MGITQRSRVRGRLGRGLDAPDETTTSASLNNYPGYAPSTTTQPSSAKWGRRKTQAAWYSGYAESTQDRHNGKAYSEGAPTHRLALAMSSKKLVPANREEVHPLVDEVVRVALTRPHGQPLPLHLIGSLAAGAAPSNSGLDCRSPRDCPREVFAYGRLPNEETRQHCPSKGASDCSDA